MMDPVIEQHLKEIETRLLDYGSLIAKSIPSIETERKVMELYHEMRNAIVRRNQQLHLYYQ